ncbi:MAG TPA: hypothetical protein DDW55_08080 [Gammaproteobacteria bacterium]|nr:hypothetical protein [Gammaproteobacteria bacterium]
MFSPILSESAINTRPMTKLQLPDQIPLFPLSGTLLLPGGNLPLHIFEQRYLDMINDSLQQDRIIGMIQPRMRESYMHEPPICTTGCAGYITHHDDTPDGCKQITLSGLYRFNIVTELDTDHLYRVAKVHYLTPDNTGKASDNNAVGDDKISRLMHSLSAYLPMLDTDINAQQLQGNQSAKMVNKLAMYCPFSAMEKQALLEAANLDARTDMLIDLIERSLLENWHSDESLLN